MTNILFKKQFYKILRLKLNDPYLCYYILHNFIQNEKKEEENARAEKRDAETRVIETLSSCSSIEIPNGRMSCVTNVKAQSNT